MEKIKCICGKDWKIQDNLSAYKGEVVLVCDCGEKFYNAQDFFDSGKYRSLGKQAFTRDSKEGKRA